MLLQQIQQVSLYAVVNVLLKHCDFSEKQQVILYSRGVMDELLSP